MDLDRNLYYFGPFCLDVNEQVLLRGGRRVPLPAKAVSTLIVLVRNKGHIVEKDDLMKEVWPNEVVEEGNLAQHIFMLRRALGDTADCPQYIETVPRRGYRFLKDQDEIDKQIIAALPLSVNENGRQPTRSYTGNAAAYQAYLKGRHCWCKHTREGLEQAAEYFRQAIGFDPEYALAHAAIVDCYLRLATNYLPPVDALPSNAVPAQATSGEDLPLNILAALRLRYECDLKTAEREIKHAVELKSNYPAVHQWNAAYLFSRKLYRGANHKLKIGRKKDVVPGATALTPSTSVADEFQSTSLTPDEDVQMFCVVAREQIAAGNFEAAHLALQRWYTIGNWPILKGLSPHASADLLFTAGRLGGYLGSTKQIPKAQKHAEELLNGAIGIWAQLGSKRRSAEGQMELGVCYWREGLFDRARDTLLAALKELVDEDDELKTLALTRLAMNELSAGYPHDALFRLKEADAIVKNGSPLLMAIYNQRLASIFKNLAIVENRDEYFERAIVRYEEALWQFEAIGNYRFAADMENNYGDFFVTFKQLDRAEIHLARARKLYEHLADNLLPAQFDDTRARFYIAAEQFDLAEQAIAQSIANLEVSGEEAWLAESLITQGVLLCCAGRHRKAKQVLERASQIAERCGDRQGFGRALRTLSEEIFDQLEHDERLELKATLDQLFAESQQRSTGGRGRKYI